MAWVERHARCKMLIYYQDFGSTSSYRIQNYPASLAVLSNALHNGRFPSFAPEPAEGAAAAPGGWPIAP